MSIREVQEVDPSVVLLPQFGVVGSGSILLSQHCNKENLKEDMKRSKMKDENEKI